VRSKGSDFYFSDKQMTFNHDFRCFCCGSEITHHVCGSISVNRADRDAPGTASFDLDNVNDIFLLTASNKGYSKDDDGNFYEDSESSSTDVTNSLSQNAKDKISSLYKEKISIQNKLSEANSLLDSATTAKEEAESNLSTVETSLDEYSKMDSVDKENNKSAIAKAKSNKKEYSSEITQQQKIIDEQNKNIKSYNKQLKTINSRLGNLSVKDGKYNVIGNFDTANKAQANASLQIKNKVGQQTKSTQIVTGFTNSDLYSDDLYSDSAKQLVYLNKSILNANISLGGKSNSFKPYSLTIDSCIFEKNDPLRIFIKDPSTPFSEDKWIPFFTGFIQNITDSVNYENGEKKFTIACYDIRGLMLKQRIMTNPRTSRGTDTAYDSAQNRLGKNVGLFGDYFADGGHGGEKGTKYSFTPFDKAMLDVITERSICDDEFIDNIIGKVVSTQSNEVVSGEYYNLAKVDPKNKNSYPGSKGMGCFMPGLRMKCPSYENEKSKHIKYLELWYDLLVFGTKCTYLTSDEVQKIGTSTIPWGEFDPYNGFVHMLVPEDGGIASGIFSSQLEDLSPGFEFQSRFELITQACTTVDYQWYCNGMGDVVFEFPMYDFVPESFGAYANQLKVNNHLLTTSINEITDDVVTAVSVTGGINRSETAPEGTVAFAFTAFAKSDQLAYKYGINVEEYTIPTMRMDSGRTKLARQAAIELVKRNVNASSLEADMCYRVALYPNKPFLHVPRGRMGNISAFTYNYNVNESISVSVGLRYIKKKLEDNTFISIFNGTSMPVRYTKGNQIDSDLDDSSSSGIDVFNIE